MSDPHPPAAPDEHDAWLRQALRHAPDAAAAPPPALREAILAEARSAVQGGRRSAPRPSLADRAAAFSSWLARPAVAASFASVMAATLVGLMWWDRPMDETLPPPRSSRSVEPVAAPAAATATEAAPSLRTAPLPRPEAPLSRPATTPTSPSPTAAKRADSAREEKASAGATTAAPGKEGVPQDALQAAPSPSPFPGNGPAANAAAARDRAAMPALAKKAESPTMAAATQAPERAATPPPPAAPTETARRLDIAANDAKGGGVTDAARAATPARQRAAMPSGDAASHEATGALDATAGAAPRAFAATPPPLHEAISSESKAADAAAARPMAALLGSIAQGTGHWSRTVPTGSIAPLDAPTESWLASVDAATTGRWQAAGEPASRLEGDLTAPANALRVGRDGRNAAIVRIEDAGVLFEMPPGPAWFAPLPPEAVARLRATLAATQR